MEHEDAKGTILSQHIWGLKSASILLSVKTLSPRQGGTATTPYDEQCRLCLPQKWHILFKPEVARYNFYQSDVQYFHFIMYAI